MLNNIYQEIILDHYQNPKNFGSLKNPSVSHQEMNSFCGDKIRMELKIQSDKITAVAFSGQGCVISIACASLLTDYLKNKSLQQARQLKKEEVSGLLGINLSPARLKCAWLPWEVLQKALNKYIIIKQGGKHG